MRLQLNPAQPRSAARLSRLLGALLCWGSAVLLLFRGTPALAQSTVKAKRLWYDERAPGIRVDEEEVEVLLELPNEDEVSATVLHDTITGASPVGVTLDTVTGASAKPGRNQEFANFHDERWAVDLGYSPLITRILRGSAAFHYSEEQDYLSRGLTLGGSLELNKKNTVVSPSFTYFDDLVIPQNAKPTQGKLTREANLAVSQVLDATNVLTLGLSSGTATGYLTDPYKLVLVGDTPQDESRPDSRDFLALALAWRTKPLEHHAFEVSLRRYQDDWGVDSDTLRLQSFSDLTDRWLLNLLLRYYQQSRADFWNDAWAADNTARYRSADPRLSSFLAITYGATGIYRASDAWWFEASLSRYLQFDSSCTLSFAGGEDRANPPPGLATRDDEGEDEHEGEDEGEGGYSSCSVWRDSDAFVAAWVASLAVQYRF